MIVGNNAIVAIGAKCADCGYFGGYIVGLLRVWQVDGQPHDLMYADHARTIQLAHTLAQSK